MGLGPGQFVKTETHYPRIVGYLTQPTKVDKLMASNSIKWWSIILQFKSPKW